jgi:hypothetical protein
MGTINYMTGDIITLGLNLDTIEIEEDEINEMVEEEGYEREDAIEVWKELYEKDIKALCNEWIDKSPLNTEYFDIKLGNGYYEGFYITVDKKYMTDKEIEISRKKCEYPSFLYDLWKLSDEEKEDIKNEIKEHLRPLLVRLISYIDVCYPSWCTSYEFTYKENVDAIDKALNEAINNL